MTLAADKLPSIYFLEGKGWTAKIGYHLAAEGKRVRSYHYLGQNKVPALSLAIQIAADWQDEVKDFPEFSKRLTAHYGLTIDLPVWHTKARKGAVRKIAYLEKFMADHDAREKKTDEDAQTAVDYVEASRRVAAADPRFAKYFPEDPSKPFRVSKLVEGKWVDFVPSPEVMRAAQLAMPQGRVLAIEQVKDEFLAYKEQKVGGHTNRGGVQKITHRSMQNNLKGIFAAFHLAGIVATDPISKLDGPTLENLFDRMYQRVKQNEISEKTAANYCGALKQMVEWAHRQSTINFRLPDNAEDILHVPAPKRNGEVRPYNPEIIKVLLKRLKAKGDEKTALAVLLALCTGAYQSDIGNWGYQRQDEPNEKPYDNLVTDNGETYVFWRRQKTRNHNGFFSLHLLPPEVVKLLHKYLMPSDPKKNPYMRLILNSDNTPLYAEGANRPNDCIGRQYVRARNEVEDEMRKEIADPKAAKELRIKYPFEQFRKDVMNFVSQTGKSTDMTQQFAGHTNEGRKREHADEMKRQFTGAGRPGVLDRYLRDDFSDLTAILRQWHEQLRKDGIFEAAGIIIGH